MMYGISCMLYDICCEIKTDDDTVLNMYFTVYKIEYVKYN